VVALTTVREGGRGSATRVEWEQPISNGDSAVGGYIFCGRREWMRGFFGDSVGGVCVCAVCESQKELGRNRKKRGGFFENQSRRVLHNGHERKKEQRKNEMLNKGVCELRIIC